MDEAAIKRAREIIADGEKTEDAAWFVDNCNDLLQGWKDALDEVERLRGAPVASPRDLQQARIASFVRSAFGDEQATSLAQRALRLLEEAIEAFQSVNGDPEQAHELVDYVFGRPPGVLHQELGGVSVCVLALAAAAGLSAAEEENREVNRVLAKPVSHFQERNAAKNAAGFLARTTSEAPKADRIRRPLSRPSTVPSTYISLEAPESVIALQADRLRRPSDPSTGRVPALWFDSKGCGPDHFYLEVFPFKELRDGDKLVAPPSLGLRLRAGDLVILGRGMIDGGFNMERAQIAELHRQLGAWLAEIPE